MELRILIFLFVLAIAMTVSFFYAVFGGTEKRKMTGFEFKQLQDVSDKQKDEMREQIFHLHRRGNTFQQIAKSLKISRSTAHKYYQQYIEKNNEHQRA